MLESRVTLGSLEASEALKASTKLELPADTLEQVLDSDSDIKGSVLQDWVGITASVLQDWVGIMDLVQDWA